MLKDPNVHVAVTSSYIFSYFLQFLAEGKGLILGLALCGSLVYVMNTREFPLYARLMYVLIATFIGYGGAVSLVDAGMYQAVVAFLLSVFSVAICIRVLGFIKSDDFLKETIDFILKLIGRGK